MRWERQCDIVSAHYVTPIRIGLEAIDCATGEEASDYIAMSMSKGPLLKRFIKVDRGNLCSEWLWPRKIYRFMNTLFVKPMGFPAFFRGLPILERQTLDRNEGLILYVLFTLINFVLNIK